MDNKTPSHFDAQATTIQSWADQLHTLTTSLARRFARTEARQRMSAYLQGLLSPLERKNGWQLAEQAGYSTPYGVQHLLGRACWDADRVRDDLRDYSLAHLSDPEAVLVLDETGFLKKGDKSAGVARQYSGTAGRIENCQIGVFLSYASAKGHVFLDRELYLPKEWADDPPRRKQAAIPEETTFVTKPKIARAMLERAFAAGVPCRWVTGDCVYGNDRSLRFWLEEQGKAYVMAVSGQETVYIGWQQYRVKHLLAQVPEHAWQRLSAGAGSKGPRLYDWAYVRVNSVSPEGWQRGLLVRRSISAPEEKTAYVTFAPSDTPMQTLVAVAGTRWTIEQCLEESKGQVGLDQYEVRCWHGWYRHITLCLLAHAFLAVMRANGLEPAPKGGPMPPRNSLRQFKSQRGLCCP